MEGEGKNSEEKGKGTVGNKAMIIIVANYS